MPIKHAFSLLCCNLKLVSKVLLFVMIALVLATALCVGILHPVYTDIRQIVENPEQPYVVSSERFINHPFLTLGELVDKYTVFIRETENWKGKLFLLVLVIIGFKFFLTLPLLPVTKELYTKMSTGFDIGLVYAFISTGLQNLLLSLLCSVVLTFVDLVGITGAVFLCRTMLRSHFVALRLSGFFVSGMLLFLFLTFRIAVCCQWLPEICRSESKNIFSMLKKSMKTSFKRFGKNFLCMALINFCFIGIICATTLLSFGIIPALCIPIYYVLYCLLSLTLNFSYHKSKYYLDNGETVYTPTKLF